MPMPLQPPPSTAWYSAMVSDCILWQMVNRGDGIFILYFVVLCRIWKRRPFAHTTETGRTNTYSFADKRVEQNVCMISCYTQTVDREWVVQVLYCFFFCVWVYVVFTLSVFNFFSSRARSYRRRNADNAMQKPKQSNKRNYNFYC